MVRNEMHWLCQDFVKFPGRKRKSFAGKQLAVMWLPVLLVDIWYRAYKKHEKVANGGR
jgi:hypothetical protein